MKDPNLYGYADLTTLRNVYTAARGAVSFRLGGEIERAREKEAVVDALMRGSVIGLNIVEDAELVELLAQQGEPWLDVVHGELLGGVAWSERSPENFRIPDIEGGRVSCAAERWKVVADGRAVCACGALVELDKTNAPEPLRHEAGQTSETWRMFSAPLEGGAS